jgi:hypothetical protein
MPGSRESRIAVASPIPVEDPVTSATGTFATVFENGNLDRTPSPALIFLAAVVVLVG